MQPLGYFTTHTAAPPFGSQPITLESIRAAMAKMPKWTGPHGFVMLSTDVSKLAKQLPSDTAVITMGGWVFGLDNLFTETLFSATDFKDAARLIWRHGLRGRRIEMVGDLGIEFLKMEAANLLGYIP